MALSDYADTFMLDGVVEMDRGMTDEEALVFLATGVTPDDISRRPSTPEEVEASRAEANASAEGDAAPEMTVQETDINPVTLSDVIIAAGQVHTGVMVALVPTSDDAHRIVVDSGEPVDELHCTLMYLGDADSIPEDQLHALIDTVAQRASMLMPIEGDAFGLSVFNPHNAERETCVVLQLSGEELEAVHTFICDGVDAVVTNPGVQYKPWIPHITLAYTEDTDLSEYVDQLGPIEFDRIRVAIAGDVYDYTLGREAETGQTDTYDTNLVSSTSSLNIQDEESGSNYSDWSDEHDIHVQAALAEYIAWAKERDVNIPAGPGHQLRDYWVRGPGAAKIGWGTDGSMRRCIAELGKYVKSPGGLCAEYHRMATGEWPRGGNIPSEGDTVSFDNVASQ